jgi:hypothetical protein
LFEAETLTETLPDPSTSGSGSACGSNEVPCSVSVAVYPGKFWQVENGDVITGGSIKSYIPASNYFNLKGTDSPGLPIYKSNLTLGEGEVSETKWIAQTDISSTISSFKYDYFVNKVPSEVKGKWGENQGVVNNPQGDKTLNDLKSSGTLVNGYYWTKVGGDLSLSTSNNFNSKLILFVNGNLAIKGNITLASNGFLMVIVSGNIDIDPNVASIQGIYISNGDFSTGTKGPRQDSQLNVTGTVISLGNVNLERSLSANQAQNIPAEKFTFSPSYFLQIPYSFLKKDFNWREVNP